MATLELVSYPIVVSLSLVLATLLFYGGRLYHARMLVAKLKKQGLVIALSDFGRYLTDKY